MLKKQRSTLHFKPAARALSKAPIARAKRAIPSLRSKPRFRIGIWDIDVYAGFLFRVLDKLNDGQHLFRFTRIEATVPMGLTVSGDRTRQLVKDYGGNPDAPDIAHNVYTQDVLDASEPMRKSLDIDVLACVVSPMLMLHPHGNKRKLGWNFFSSARKGAIVVSAYNLRIYAAKAKRPFEATLATLVLSSALCSVFSGVGFHHETRGCPLDYCENRDDIVLTLRKLQMCEETLQQVPEDARPDVLRMLDILREYRR